MTINKSSTGFSAIEIVNPDFESGKIRFALFDFDGTISLIREGWQSIMIPMMVEIMQKETRLADTAALEAVVKDFVTRLTGQQTIYQMIQLCEEIEKRGGKAENPLFYKNMYNDRLNAHIRHRIAALKEKRAEPEEMCVPGALDWLRMMKKREIHCYLASGTDEKYVCEEAELLGLPPYFENIYGARDNYKSFSKKMVIDQIIAEHHLHGSEFAAFGDGYVEIEDSKSAGGITIGLATNEKDRMGIDEWKRSRLIRAGADLIIPDFRPVYELEKLLFKEE